MLAVVTMFPACIIVAVSQVTLPVTAQWLCSAALLGLGWTLDVFATIPAQIFCIFFFVGPDLVAIEQHCGPDGFLA